MLPAETLPRLRVELGEVDLVAGVLHGSDEPVRLTEIEAALLRHLARHAEVAVSRSALHEAVWHYAPSVLSRAVDQAVRRLRTKIERDPADPRHVLTAHGVGYRWVPWMPAVRPHAEPAAKDVLVIGDRRIDLARGTLDFPDGNGRLSAAEVDILRTLRDANGRVVDRAALKRAVWGGQSTTDRAVTNAVHRLRAKLGPGQPRAVRGIGYCLAEGQSPGSAPPTNLFEPPSTLVGRHRELREVQQALGGGARLLSLVGAPGIGKTRLAVRAAALNRHAWPGGVWWCDLGEARTRDDVVAAVAMALGAADAPISAVLRQRGSTLVVLDTFEQVVVHAAHTVGRWCAEAPAATFVVTSRERLRLDGEHVYRVGPLDPGDGAALFAGLAAQAGAPWDRVHWTDAIAGIVEKLDGIPLPLELAAERAAVLDPRQLQLRLDDDRFALLTSARRDAPARHTTWWAALDWSWVQLSDEERGLLVQLAAFPGNFDWPAVAAVSGPGASGSSVLERLVEKSLVRVLPGGSAYALFSSVRAYARARSEVNFDLRDRQSLKVAALEPMFPLRHSAGRGSR